MTPRTLHDWRVWANALQVQTARQATKVEELLDEIERLLISHESLNQRLGEALNEVTYWRLRATEAEQRLPDRLRIVGPEESA